MKKRWRLYIFLMVFLLLLGVGFLFSPYFRLHQLSFSGENFVASAELNAFSASYRYRNGVWLFTSGALKRHLLRQFPQIDTLKFQWRSRHHLNVWVNEKIPWASFLIDDQLHVVAQDGTLLTRRASSGEVSGFDDLVLVKGVSKAYFDGPVLSGIIVGAIQQVMDSLVRWFPNERYHLIFKGPLMDDDGGAELIVMWHDTIPVEVGSTAKIDDKLRLFAQFLDGVSFAEVDQMCSVDLRVSGTVIVGENCSAPSGSN